MSVAFTHNKCGQLAIKSYTVLAVLVTDSSHFSLITFTNFRKLKNLCMYVGGLGIRNDKYENLLG
jgi:hypothetical protein